MSGFSLDFETWHFHFDLAFDLRPFLEPYNDDRGSKGEIILPMSKLARRTRLRGYFKKDYYLH